MSKRKLQIVFVCVFLLIGGLATYLWQVRSSSPREIPVYYYPSVSAQARNLQRLAIVWGFAKYTHPVFLSGHMCWDDELLWLIPIVQFANEEVVNDIIYEWLVGLGEDGFGEGESFFLRLPLDDPSKEALYITFLFEKVASSPYISIVAPIQGPDYMSMILRIDKNYLYYLFDKEAYYDLVHSLLPVCESYIISVASLDWLNNASFLGSDIVSVLSRFNEVTMLDRTYAPVRFLHISAVNLYKKCW